MESLGGLKIEKLSDDNFHIWKQKVEFVLAFRELDDVVTDATPPVDEDRKHEWKKRDAKAKAIIGLTLSDDHLDHVRGLATAADMWDALVNVFQRRTLLNKLNARRNFYSAKMNDGERVLVYINRVRQLASDLKSMDIAAEDEDIAMTVLCGLPDRFEHLIVAIDTVTSERQLTLEFVKSRLLQEEQRLSERDSVVSKSNAALLSKHSLSPKHCDYCHKDGHTEPYCWKKQREERARAKNTKAKVAIAAGSKQSKTAVRCDTDSDSDDFLCLITHAASRSAASSKVWHIDSGATAHMTFDRSLFETFEAVPPFDVGMGDDSTVEAHGRGTVTLTLLVKGKPTKCRLLDVAFIPKLQYHLVSVSTIECSGGKVVFENGKCHIMNGSRLLAEGTRRKKLYVLNTAAAQASGDPDIALMVPDLSLWHARLAHVNMDGIMTMVKKRVVNGINIDLKHDAQICESCVHGKSHRAPIPKQGGNARHMCSSLSTRIYTVLCARRPLVGLDISSHSSTTILVTQLYT